MIVPNTSESRLELCNNIQQLVSNHSNLLLTAMRPEYEFTKFHVYLWRNASCKKPTQKYHCFVL